MRIRQDRRLVRRDEQWLTLPNPWDVPVDICADERVPLEPAAVDEVLSVLETADTLARLAETVPGHDGPPPRMVRLVLTPDFHKGAGIPIGTVVETEGALLPQAVGNDVNCGMRLEVTSLTVEQVRPRLDALERRLRHLFFEGGRRIALTPAQREALLRDGLPGLLLTGDAPGKATSPPTPRTAWTVCTPRRTRPAPPRRSPTGSPARAPTRPPATTASSAASAAATTSPSCSMWHGSTIPPPRTRGGWQRARSS
ncbi:RtcB family protein [Nonomuraea antimicrobica]